MNFKIHLLGLFLITRRVPKGTAWPYCDHCEHLQLAYRVTDLISNIHRCYLLHMMSIAVKIKYVISTSFNYVIIPLEVHYVLQTRIH